MQGLHIFADLHDCPSSVYLTSARALETLCRSACEGAGLTVLGADFYQFDHFDQAASRDVKGGGGATGAVVLAESHLAIHTWPERACATLDVYVCNVSVDNSEKAEAVYAALIAALRPEEVLADRRWRGRDLPSNLESRAKRAA